MSCLRLFSLKCATLLLAAQLNAVPASADNISAGGFIIIGSSPLSLHHRSKHKVHRYYGAPEVYRHKTKPKVYHDRRKPKTYGHAKHRQHYVKPVKRYNRSVRKVPRTRSSPYYIPQNYGIQRRTFGYGVSRSRY
ncbi:hypothetical protein [Ruegeria sp. SCP11]|uniref:hypothetical protein n=1 Tax=Ruegeria sp. SCP11 TaxID=3141378 RepID=UPI00333D03BA